MLTSLEFANHELVRESDLAEVPALVIGLKNWG